MITVPALHHLDHGLQAEVVEAADRDGRVGHGGVEEDRQDASRFVYVTGDEVRSGFAPTSADTAERRPGMPKYCTPRNLNHFNLILKYYINFSGKIILLRNKNPKF